MAVCPLVAAVILIHREEGPAGVKRLLRRVRDHRRIRPKVVVSADPAVEPVILVAAYG